jgi:hypothetical protein
MTVKEVRIMLQPFIIAPSIVAAAQPAATPPACSIRQIDYDGFRALIEEVRPYRRRGCSPGTTFAAAAR